MSKDSMNHKVKIGGLLIVVGIFLWFGVIAAFINTLAGLLSLAKHIPTVPPEPLFLVIGIANFVLLGPMLVMFHRRKAGLVRWVVIYGIYAVFCECYIQYLSIIRHLSTTLAGHVIAVVVMALLMTGVVTYFFTSRRVKRTFVR